jgi:hypothetical protein
LTLYELDLLSVRHRRLQHMEDRRAAMPAWILVNVNRDSAKKPEPFSLEDVVGWLGHGFHARQRPPQEPGPPTTETLKDRLGIVHMLHKGLYGDNGQRAEGS